MKPIPRRLKRAILGLLAVGAAGLVSLAVFLAYCIYTLPLAHGPAEQAAAAAVFENGDGHAFALRGVYRGERLAAGQLPADLVHAVVAIEDRRFFDHPGVDLHGILRAAWHDWRDGGPLEGGSTITQQLARLTYLSPERSIRRKVQEAMLAVWLEARLSKEEILARYLNAVYFGSGAVGADAAAERYFRKRAAALDLAESALLAGLVRAPSELAPSRNPEGAQRRAETVLQAMVEAGYIDAARAAQARAHPARLAMAPEPEPGSNYFIDAAEAEVKSVMGPPPVDVAVATTLDPRLQAAAERVVNRWLATEGARRHAGQAALVALAPDGAVLAMVGGRDYARSQFNRATQARRQPGSLFKIFVYLAAFGAGYTQDSMMTDQPLQIGEWEPHNYDGRFRGPVSLSTAFAQSINSISVQLVQAVGVQRVIDMAKSLGVRSELPPVPSLALGSAEVTLFEMTRAMDAIAIDSKTAAAYLVRSIRAANGTPLYTRPETRAATPAWDRNSLVHLLEAVVTEGTGKAARLDRRVAGKTGTTQEYRDAWFVGFTTDMVVGVWVGNDDNSPMQHVAGGDLPAKIWHDYVAEAERLIAQRAPAEARALSGSGAPPAKPAALEQAGPAAAPAATARPASPAAAPLHGVPLVVDTATLVVHGTVVHLSGIDGETGDPAHDLVRYIRGREVACEPVDAPNAQQYRCRIGNYDLGEAVVLNGAGRAADSASQRLRIDEERARLAGRGVWRQ